MMRDSAAERTRYLVLVGDGKAVTRIPLPEHESLPAKKDMLKAVARIREGVLFSKGTAHEPALYLLQMQYILALTSSAEISSAVFQKDVLTSLQKLITLYRYHVPTSDAVKEFATNAAVSKSKVQYSPSLFGSAEILRQMKALGLDEEGIGHPSDVLKEFQKPITFDALSNIYICRDPFCSLSALDEASSGKYSKAVMDLLSSIESNLKKTNQLTWIGFASGNLGLTLLRMHIVLNILQKRQPKDWPAIEIVLIDPRYLEAINDISEGEKPNYNSLSERVAHEITVGALHQFAQFIAVRSPEGSKVTITVCQSAKSFIHHNIARADAGLGTCYVECDDVWVPGGSCWIHHTNSAVPDYEKLRDYVGQRAVNGKYLLVAKNDNEQEARLEVGSLGGYASRELVEDFTFKEPFRKT
jgi:hypothetical protein